ncbi:MAG: hypothetical protein R6W72_07570 [Desulfurivibrionaceae bacterium]
MINNEAFLNITCNSKYFENPDTKRRTYFNIHVPKTAGWLLWDILKINFGKDLKNAYTPTSYEYFRPESVEWLLRQYRFRCYTSHGYRLSSLPTIPGHELIAFSFIRDPVNKFLSSYFYCRGIPETGEWHPSKQLFLPEFLDRLINDPEFSRLPLDVSQEEFIRGSLKPLPFKDLLKLDFGTFHIFPTERFDDAMLCLEALYPEDFRDCSYGKRANASKKDQEVTSQDIEMIERLPWIEKDRELHKFAFEYLDNLLKTIYMSDDALEQARNDFKFRCEMKKKKEMKEGSTRLPLMKRIKSAARILLLKG